MEEFEPLNKKETSIKLRLMWETQWVYLSLCGNWLILSPRSPGLKVWKVGCYFLAMSY